MQDLAQWLEALGMLSMRSALPRTVLISRRSGI